MKPNASFGNVWTTTAPTPLREPKGDGLTVFEAPEEWQPTVSPVYLDDHKRFRVVGPAHETRFSLSDLFA